MAIPFSSSHPSSMPTKASHVRIIPTLKDSWDDTYSRYEVDWENETKYVYIWVDHDWTSDNGSLIYEEHVTALVPNGYDGLIRGYIYPNIESEDIRDIDDYSQVYLFRMN